MNGLELYLEIHGVGGPLILFSEQPDPKEGPT